MTEPREPEPVVDADEAVAPEVAPGADAPVEVPEVSPWHPVQPAETSDAAEFEPAQPGVAEPLGEPETVVAAAPEPITEPVAGTELEAQVASAPEPVSSPTPIEEPEVVEPTMVAVEPEPTLVPPPAEPEPAAEPVIEAGPVIVEAERETAETVAISPLAAPIVEPTIVIPEEPVSQVAAPTESIFRPASPSQEQTTIEQLSDEEAKLAAERAARRDARVAALAATAPVAFAAPAPVVVHKRTNDKFWGSLGLFLLRLVVAGIFAIRGMNILTDIPAAQELFAKTIIPEPQIMAIVTGVASLLIALSLVLGLLTRLAGLGIALIAGGVLAFVLWGPWSPFVAGQPGFLGELELLLAAVGLLFLLVGAGGWSLDRSFRAGRERDKAERAAAAN